MDRRQLRLSLGRLNPKALMPLTLNRSENHDRTGNYYQVYRPSNFRGARVKATAAAGSITLHWDHALNSEHNHAAAAEALANKFKWAGQWLQGGIPSDSGYAFVCIPPRQGVESVVFVTKGEQVAA